MGVTDCTRVQRLRTAPTCQCAPTRATNPLPSGAAPTRAPPLALGSSLPPGPRQSFQGEFINAVYQSLLPPSRLVASITRVIVYSEEIGLFTLADGTVLLLSDPMVYRSTDHGETWAYTTPLLPGLVQGSGASIFCPGATKACPSATALIRALV